MNVRPYGESALLAEPDDPHTVPALRDAATRLAGVVEVVAGACTLLVVLDAAADPTWVGAALSSLLPAMNAPVADDIVELPVRYDGADLDEVAQLTGLDRDTVIGVHSGALYTVRFCGFSPGFAYLDGLDERLHVSRRSDPRTSVPAGSVGIAGEFSGVYPRASPGGWRLLGRTDAVLWDATRTAPALLAPGTAVRFVPA